MPYFQKPKVDLRSKKAMTEFLESHFRYFTMSSVNRMTSYANCIKVHRLGLTREQLSAAFEVLEADEYWDEIRYPIDLFTAEMNGEYTIGCGGRSGGYLVLRKSSWEQTEDKSYCRTCGGKNFKMVYQAANAVEAVITEAVFKNRTLKAPAILALPEISALSLNQDGKLLVIERALCLTRDHTFSNRCGHCGAEGDGGRVNYTAIPKRLKVSGRSVDQDQDYREWTGSALREQVELVRRFDQACDEIRENFIGLIENYKVVEEVILVPKHRKVLAPVSVSH